MVVFHDGAAYWLADGFHRVTGAVSAGKTEIDADVRQGTRRDAILFSVGANAAHGLRRTNADKRRAVETLLRDEEWRAWSDVEIGRRCGTSHTFAAKIRAEVAPQPATVAGSPSAPETRKGADGKTRKLPKARASKPAAPEPEPEPTSEADDDAPESEPARATEDETPQRTPLVASVGERTAARAEDPRRAQQAHALRRALGEAAAAVAWLLDAGGGDVSRLGKLRQSLRECQATAKSIL